MAKEKFPKKIITLLKSIKNKRAKVVIDSILKHGSISTETLEKKYGYNHPPRAARDVREAGIPLETFTISSSDGRKIAAYRFGDFSKIQKDKLGGRKIFSKKFKNALYAHYKGKCVVCSGSSEERYLQIDHKLPYEVAGEINSENRKMSDYMLLCGSCNRAKSWSCEHCPNWLIEKNPKICSHCYWANPANHLHVALKEVRRVDIIWNSDEVQIYNKLRKEAEKNDNAIPAYVKKIIKNHLFK
ncbi:HNH endonuclease [Candidatus Micrarchaeota archaeon CG1_02_47_40]|nr:MAG: HNH endonuclease [Candidatus Micrarchaeota archaeon CG1_02_47_40]